jgi:hypothetical protein
MTLQQLITTVMESQSEDWIFDDGRQSWVCKLDLNVRFQGPPISFDQEPEEFAEPWTKSFPSPKAYRANFQLWYGTSMVRDYFFVDVDGHRALLPLPRSYNELVITREQERVAQILNCAHENSAAYFRRYIQRFEVADAAELRPV